MNERFADDDLRLLQAVSRPLMCKPGAAKPACANVPMCQAEMIACPAKKTRHGKAAEGCSTPGDAALGVDPHSIL